MDGAPRQTPWDRAAAFAALFQDHPSEALVANLSAEVDIEFCGGVPLPCTRSAAHTCYLCCPSAAYVDYAREELRVLKAGALLSLAVTPLLAFGRLLIAVAGLDKQVQINNWLLSTNPPSDLRAKAIEALVETLALCDADRVIYWRSLNAETDRDLLASLARSGWILIPARMVYLFDCRSAPPRLHQNERRDRALLDKGSHAVIAGRDFTTQDFTRAAALYGLLYLEKYTLLNPHYTPLFIERMTRLGLLDLYGLRSREGRLDGVIGFFDQDDVMTAPIVGYETGLEPALGLYRMLMAIGYKRARDRGMLFNISAGAGSFKRLRGAVPVLEYSAAYCRHRPWVRQAATKLLATLLSVIAVPLLRKRRL